MKKIILVLMLVLGLIMILMPAQAFAKISYSMITTAKGADKKSINDFIYYGIYDYKKFGNIQKADKSENSYDFFISDSSTVPYDNVYCNVASIFVFTVKTQDTWKAIRGICDNGKDLILGEGSIKKGVSELRTIVIRRIMTETNKEYKSWR